MVWVSAVILLAVLQYLVIGVFVGMARGWYGVAAPATTGHPKFERWFRVHQNSLEMLMAFIPAMWLFGWWVSQTWAVGIGLVFVAARILYSIQYIHEPRSREFGAGLSFLTVFVLVIGGIVGAVRIGLTN
ncbi:MAG: MAPEG family protein [Gammaproteobacteria bacterium]